ncbi:MAG TPA: rhomboid family intramembrane serine protease [Candidatus Acidoferrales bacterium]|nr:rhomboid family intramembrane serine protease [Candidatus Acidoferrales bacterium]
MIFPLWVQGLGERPWPYVTTIIILINCAVFFATHAQIERESREMARVELPMLLIAAAHPEVQPPADAKPLVDSFAQDNKELWDGIRSGKQPPINEWDREMRDWGDTQASDEMASLADRLKRDQSDSVLQKYAFYPYKPTVMGFLTANFLHGGWLHLIFNMWFLWLAGAMMESAWGPMIYTGFYLLAGATGLIAHATTYPHSVVPVLGASGAIAGLIGGFLVRFPHVKIDLVVIYFRIIRVAWPAVIVLPVWILLQLLWGSLAQTSGGVAYWAHVGGFVFGMAMAIALRLMGLERTIAETGEPELAR